jgi:hypothetical protein
MVQIRIPLQGAYAQNSFSFVANDTSLTQMLPFSFHRLANSFTPCTNPRRTMSFCGHVGITMFEAGEVSTDTEKESVI